MNWARYSVAVAEVLVKRSEVVATERRVSDGVDAAAPAAVVGPAAFGASLSVTTSCALEYMMTFAY